MSNIKETWLDAHTYLCQEAESKGDFDDFGGYVSAVADRLFVECGYNKRAAYELALTLTDYSALLDHINDVVRTHNPGRNAVVWA